MMSRFTVPFIVAFIVTMFYYGTMSSTQPETIQLCLDILTFCSSHRNQCDLPDDGQRLLHHARHTKR